MIKKIILFFALVLTLTNCSRNSEPPLALPPGAEPSAKIHNDRGLSHYEKGRYFDALLEFTQASVADNSTGEIHFNIALMLHQRSEEKRAKERFELARKFANGNKTILESGLLKKYLSQE